MKRLLLKGIAITIDVGAPLIATLTQFPIWVERSAGSTVSGVFVVFALLSAIPLFKLFRDKLRTPSIPIIWLLAFMFLVGINAIIDEMILITFVGTVSNAVGFILFKLAGKEEKK